MTFVGEFETTPSLVAVLQDFLDRREGWPVQLLQIEHVFVNGQVGYRIRYRAAGGLVKNQTAMESELPQQLLVDSEI